MKLKAVNIHKYKSIEHSQSFQVEEDITILVGMNESGKTATLEALAKSHYFNNDKAFQYNTTHDYPRKEKKKMDRSGKNPAAITCTYEIGEELLTTIEQDVGQGNLSGTEVSITTKYSGGATWNTPTVDLPAFVRHKLEQSSIEKEEELEKDLVEAFENNNFNALLEKYKGEEDFEEEKEDFGLPEFIEGFRKYFENGFGWEDVLKAYVASTYIAPARPKFLYYDEYYMLPSRISLEKLENQELEEEELKTAKALIELTDLDIDTIKDTEDFEEFVAELEATQAEISEELFKYWTTNKHLSIEFKVEKKEEPIYTSNNYNQRRESTIVEHILDIRVKNTKKRISLPLKNRSKGFNWFFSFLVWFKSIQEDKDSSYIILLDEPGLNLHAAAQADLLRFIEDLVPEYQIVYTTHSPFMVPSDKLHRVRTVLDTQEGTQISDTIQEKDPNTLFPLQAALGYDIAQNLFIAKKNLLIEGVSDLIFLQTMSGILEAVGRTGLREDIVLVPTGGLEKVATFISLMRGSNLEIACLLDSFSDPKSKAKLDKYLKAKIIQEKKIIYFDKFVEQDKADIEDLFSKEDYLKLFNAAFDNYPTIDLQQLNNNIPSILIQLEKYLKEEGKLENKNRFNHYRPANQLAKLGPDANYFEKETLDRFEQCIQTVNALFD